MAPVMRLALLQQACCCTLPKKPWENERTIYSKTHQPESQKCLKHFFSLSLSLYIYIYVYIVFFFWGGGWGGGLFAVLEPSRRRQCFRADSKRNKGQNAVSTSAFGMVAKGIMAFLYPRLPPPPTPPQRDT